MFIIVLVLRLFRDMDAKRVGKGIGNRNRQNPADHRDFGLGAGMQTNHQAQSGNHPGRQAKADTGAQRKLHIYNRTGLD